MADGFGQKGISKNYPVESDSGIGANQYHKDREINLVPEEGSNVPRRTKVGLKA